MSYSCYRTIGVVFLLWLVDQSSLLLTGKTRALVLPFRANSCIVSATEIATGMTIVQDTTVRTLAFLLEAIPMLPGQPRY